MNWISFEDHLPKQYRMVWLKTQDLMVLGYLDRHGKCYEVYCDTNTHIQIKNNVTHWKEALWF